jgi:hypothetical protein
MTQTADFEMKHLFTKNKQKIEARDGHLFISLIRKVRHEAPEREEIS